MPDGFSRRRFEKSTLRTVFADLCEPGNHHHDCPRRSNTCPHAGGETDGA